MSATAAGGSAAEPAGVAAGPAIDARGLSKRFGILSALIDLDLAVEPGEALAVFGPNGAGKTTLIRLLTLELRPSAGTLRLLGLEPRRDAVEIKRRSGVISHRPLLYDELSGRENLEFYARLYGVRDPADRAAELLREVGLESRADDPFRTYSRGMQQRLAVARCLLHDPQLIYLDEPFSGLDPHAARMLRETLGRLRQARRTLLLVTHNFREGLELSDRWILLQGGRQVDGGPSRGTDADAFEERYRRRLAPGARR